MINKVIAMSSSSDGVAGGYWRGVLWLSDEHSLKKATQGEGEAKKGLTRAPRQAHALPADETEWADVGDRRAESLLSMACPLENNVLLENFRKFSHRKLDYQETFLLYPKAEHIFFLFC